jgi:putative DNA methylase
VGEGGYKPKLIEVALPLAVINAEAAREKSIRHGHPSTLHLWWARRPLAAARAVIWASLVDDPSGDESLTPEVQEVERQRLFGILERLVKWENSNNPEVLAEARAEIDRCFPDGPPPILDPFAGGGAIPLEAQRLGLKALAGDLNPVAVLINKAMIEIPPRFAGMPPVHPDIDKTLTTWERAQGLAADVEAYGRWMRDEAERRIGHLYPDATGPNGEKLTPIAWIWARTVESPDPSWSGHVPLVASWTLSKRPGKPNVWIEPMVDRDTQSISYEIREGGEPSYERTVDRGGGTCIATGAAMPFSYIRPEFQEQRMGQHLMAIVCKDKGRSYLGPEQSDLVDVGSREIYQSLSGEIFDWPGRTNVVRYGMEKWHDLFTPRQLVALTAFSDLLDEVAERVSVDALDAGMADDGVRLRDGGNGALAYADAVVTYLAFAIDRLADRNSTICSWDSSRQHARNVFARQAIPMTWDFTENNPLGSSSGSWFNSVAGIARALEHLPAITVGDAAQRDARARIRECRGAAVSTDPPYYDNISYADLSDFFYVWLRRNISEVWPDECSTLLSPKAEELIANRYRAGSKNQAEEHFESGMADFMAHVVESQTAEIPATVYYAYKATETREGELRTTGWDTFLQAVLDAGLQVNATWPMRTELGNRLLASKSNALASSIVLACRPRAVSASLATRGEFIAALRAELPESVRILQSGNIAPVDMAQSTIGPGIKVFSRYAKVVEADGSSMPVSAALAVINDVLGEVLDGEEAELDSDTRFALTWFSEFGFNPGPAGDADSVANAKNTSLSGIEESGIGEARAGKFRLYERSELPPGYSPVDDLRRTVWESVQHLIAALERSESEAADLLHTLGGYGERARQLAYLLYQKANDKGWAAEAGAYNGLITAWPSLRSGADATAAAAAAPVQDSLL